MVFNSLTFFLFLGVVLILHNLPFRWSTKKLNLLVASYVFYAAWNPPFIVLLWYTTVADWFIAHGIDRARSDALRRFLFVISLISNLGLLAYFKYAGFMLENFVQLCLSLGIEYRPPRPDIILPIGISFYTFHTLSYIIDIYRRRTQPTSSFVDFALYVTFFPQLVAGPILRAFQFIPQCLEPKRASRSQLSWGFSLIILGLFQKVVIADHFLARIADRLFNATEPPDFVSAWIGTLAFSGQIFADFAGYSTCALGVAHCLGFILPTNFRYPYAAIGFSDFWRRWHISLSAWLRDYLYIPLGGNRGGATRTNANLMVTMLIGGLWHGASWTFVIWGGLHGVFLVIERGLRRLVSAPRVVESLPVRVALAVATYLAVCVTWVFFRSDGLGRALGISASMMGFDWDGGRRLVTLEQVGITGIFVLGMLFTHWLLRDTSLEEQVGRVPWWLFSIVLAGMMVAICASPGEDRAFLYFQF